MLCHDRRCIVHRWSTAAAVVAPTCCNAYVSTYATAVLDFAGISTCSHQPLPPPQVDHFRTVFELAGPASAHLKAFSPAQLSYVAEALGAAKVDDVQLWGAIGARVAAGGGRPRGLGGW